MTGEAAGGVAAAAWSEFLHLQSGVVSASSSVLPRTMAEEPRKWRRGRFIDCQLPAYSCQLSDKAVRMTTEDRRLTTFSFAGDLGKFAGHDSCAFFDRDDLIDGNIRQAVHLSAGPGDFQGIDFGAFAQAKLDSRVVG